MAKNSFYKRDTQPNLGSTEPKSLPKTIGPYRVQALIDKGGSSLLYLATDPETEETVAIKTLSEEYLQNPEMVTRFHREAEMIAIADHPNIVKLYGHGEWKGGLYIAMELVDGHSLHTILTSHPFSHKKALHIVKEITAALMHLHTHGVIHRDLKPENILINDKGHVKVIDFGIAQLVDLNTIKDKGRLVGTPSYMSPEQSLDPSAASYPSDIYSLAIVAYELLTGRLHKGKIHLSLIPKGLAKILSKALEKDPKNRYQDISGFYTDLVNYIKSKERTTDQQSESNLGRLYENIQDAQRVLLPSHPPEWPAMNIGLISHHGVAVSGVYYDFFSLPNNCFGVILSEPSAQGAEGAIYSACLRGMVRTLAHFTDQPSQIVTLLNELLVNDPINQLFTMSFLILAPQQNLLRFISCGYGKLWYTPAGTSTPKILAAENMALGVDTTAEFLEITQNWNVGDNLLLHTFATVHGEGPFSEKMLQDNLSELLFYHPQRQVETLFRRVMAGARKEVDTRNITLIAVQRQE